jgi:heme exporter protein C
MDPKPKFLKILDLLTAVLMLAAVGMVFLYSPMERVMGWVQKVFYFHVSTGWVGMLGFMLAAGAGVAYLRTQNHKWDLVAVSAVEIGTVFTVILITTGSIWARPIWNTWWTWDPRLTTAAIMLMVYLAYLLLRQGIEESERRARFGAIYAIIGFISVPLTFFSIRIFGTIHPVIIAGSDPGAGAFSMTPPMLQTFLFSLVTFSFVFADLFWHRYRLACLAQEIEDWKVKNYG